MQLPADHRLAYRLDELLTLAGITRTRAYEAIAAGQLRSYKEGKRRMVTRRALEEYVASKDMSGGAA